MNNKQLQGKITPESVEKAYRTKGYKLSIGNFYMNPFGIRASGGFTNTFNDVVGLMYKGDGDKWIVEMFDATTDPGKEHLETPINAKGTGILVPGQYINSHTIGLHHGEYEALVQCNPMKLYRDNNRNDSYDMNPEMIEYGVFGVNIHRANKAAKSTYVSKWSAACQVVADPWDFERFMELCKTHDTIYGPQFTYTLFDEKDFD